MSLRASILSGLAARFVTALGHFLLVPVYLHLLGPRQFGWVGVYLTVTALAALLDLGLSQSLTREVAQGMTDASRRPELRSVLAAFERLFLALSAAILAVVTLGGPRFASVWLEMDAVTPREAASIFALIGVSIALTFLASLYFAALNGMHRQPLANAILIVSFVVRNGGAALVLWLIARSPVAMFAWQAGATLLVVLATRTCVRSYLPPSRPQAGRSGLRVLSRVKGFAAGIALMNLVSGLTQQADKLTLVRLVPLAQFGAYTLASQLTVGMQIISSVFVVALFPRLAAAAVDAGTGKESRQMFRKSSQGLAVLAVSIPSVIAWRPVEMMLAWTGNAALAQRLSVVVTLMMIAAALNATLVVPYTSLIAQGRVGVALRLTLLQSATFLALLLPLATRHGLEGAALASLAGQLVLFAAYGRLIHRTGLGGGLLAWIGDWCPAALAGTSAGALSVWAIPSVHSQAAAVLVVFVTLGAAVAASVAVTSTMRNEAVRMGRRAHRAMFS